MPIEKINQFREFRLKRKYEILLVSFLILIFGDVFFHSEIYVAPLLVIQNVLASTVLFYGKRKWRLPLLVLLVLLIVIEGYDLLFGFTYSRLVFAVLYIIYFVFLSAEVYRQMLKAKEITMSMISAVLSGFIILGLIGAYTFSIIEFFHSNSFNNLTAGTDGFSDLIYFSFITIISVGYGDITPATLLAKKAAMFFGLIGHFYSVVVIGIIIGKFISNRENKKEIEK